MLSDEDELELEVVGGAFGLVGAAFFFGLSVAGFFFGAGFEEDEDEDDDEHEGYADEADAGGVGAPAALGSEFRG